MSIQYIKNSDGTASIAAAEKIKVYYLNAQKQNPWLIHRATPTQSESLSKGGGSYTFELPLGIDAAVRRTAAPTNNQIDYDGVIKNTQLNLTVTQPFMTKAFPMLTQDMVELDGINYSPIISDQVAQSLVAAEIIEETSVLTSASDILSIDGTTATTAFEQFKLIKLKVANYLAISASNADWSGATSDIKAYDYFTAQIGSYTLSEIKIHIHPNKIMQLSNAVTEAGTGSSMQFLQFTDGTLTAIAGVAVISNQYIGENDVYFIPLNSSATPDPDLMLTKINNFYDDGNDVNVTKGWHWFNVKGLRPELVTKLSLPAA